MTEIISRAEARERGLSRYFTGRPCKYGHIRERSTRSKRCVSCATADKIRWTLSSPARHAKQLAWQRAASRRAWRDPEKRKQTNIATTQYRKTAAGRAVQKKANYAYIKKAIADPDRTPRSRSILLARALRERLNKAIKGRYRAGSAVRDLGCSIQELVTHIESQFLPEWSWAKDSWGPAWHIDHIRPLASFDLSEPTQAAAACHWTNLRPYPAIKNILEGSRQ